MDATCKDGTKGNPQEHHGAPQSTLQCTEDGAEARNVQQLDEEQLPLGHHNVVHAIVDPHRRGLAVVRAKGIVHDLTVDEVAHDQNRQTEQETNHTRNLLFPVLSAAPFRRRAAPNLWSHVNIFFIICTIFFQHRAILDFI